MSIEILKDIPLGDMLARYYYETESKNVELQLLPALREPLPREAKRMGIDSLVQLKLVGDAYPGAYAAGGTMRQGPSVFDLRLKEQTVEEYHSVTEVVTKLKNSRSCVAEHHLIWHQGEKTVRTYVVLRNEGTESVGVEMLSSFSLGGLTPYTPGDAHGTMKIHRVRSVWSMEGRLQTDTPEALQLEPAWSYHATRCERFGQVGSMPVNRWFPWLMIEDTANGIFWGAQIAHNASWQMEIYRKDDALAISGGLADREFGHWMKELAAGEELLTPEAILTVCRSASLDSAAQRLTSGQIAAINAGPESEQDLPVMFNEYCTTWGCPSHENISGILERVKGKGLSYFVIDCGWFKKDGVNWDISMGDYRISDSLFPQGLEHTVQAIRDAGMVPGIWFEIDNVGCAADGYQMTEHLLKRDSVPVTTTGRRFWDMNDPWVREHLNRQIIEMMKHYGFGYIKMDYNDSIGLGCDGWESLGEGLRQNMNAAYAFIEKMKQEIPGLIVENCSSGGHKLEPKMLGVSAMASFSDAHECPEIPVIAANLHRVMQPRQSQIWAVIRKTDTVQRIVYSLAATMLGRMCLSGDVTELSAEQWKTIEDGIAFYKRVAPIIRDGESVWYGQEQNAWRHLSGWQGIVRHGENAEVLCVIHRFEGGEAAQIRLPEGDYEILSVYTSDGQVCVEGDLLRWDHIQDWSACAVHLKKK